MTTQPATFVGQGNYVYESDLTWGRRKGGVPWFGVSQGVARDSRDRVYVFQRSPVACVLIFNRNGKLRDSWGFGRFKHPHGIWFNDEDEIFMTDRETHLVTKWTSDGRFVRSWGTANAPGAPGAPFNEPTKAFETTDGEMYVSDGYGQFRMHRFDRKGELVRSWGEKGTGPSQFALPHDVVVDSRNRVLACDRENDRVQIFDRAGDFQSEWVHMKRPMQIVEQENALYIAQASFAVGVFDLDGMELSSWEYRSITPREANAPHSIAVDSRGDIYIGEVTGEDGLRKFVRQ